MENVSVQDIVRATGGVLLSGNNDALLNKIRLDSRQVEAGDLFVPIIGEKVDAHRFLPQVAENGAGAVLTSEQNAKTEEMEKTSCAWIAVDDTKKALQAGSDCDPDRKMGAVDADRSMEIQKCYR